ncbi:MAG: hypothetical protein V3W18_03145 [candidate division Zixibacteria bacterium]
MARVFIISLVMTLLFAVNAAAQTGACCANVECVGNLTEEECVALDGEWYGTEDCDAGFECPPCGSYIPGDFNGNGRVNIADVIDIYSWARLGWPTGGLFCECPPGSGNFWAVAGDVNNSCSVNIADIITIFSKLKTGAPDLVPCELCPPY